MSSIHDRLRTSTAKEEGKPQWYDAVWERYPNIADVLAGCPKGPNGEPAVPPMSILIKSFQGQLQFSFSVQGESSGWSGPVDAPESLLEAIELRLAAGAVTAFDKNSGRPSGKR